MSTPTYFRFQVKSSGQWLNIYNGNFVGGSTPGKYACQGYQANSDNFFWTLISTNDPDWSLIQVKSSQQYLNLNNNVVCQNPLPENIVTPPDRFLWNISTPDEDGWSLFKLKSNSQHLNVLNSSQGNSDPVGMGDPPATPNFKWMKYNAVATPVTVTLNLLNCNEIFKLGSGTTVTPLNERNAGSYLSMTDTNNGQYENPSDINSFESLLNPGSQVTWQVNKESGSNNTGFTARISIITFEQGTGVFSSDKMNIAPGSSATAQVIYNAIHPDRGDNESYSITFTLTDGNGTTKTYIFDPKIKINPSN